VKPYTVAEQQLLALLRALEANPLDQETGRPATFDRECLLRHGRLFFQDEMEDWTKAFDRLLGYGHLRREGTAIHLTNRSRAAAEGHRKRFTGQRFGRLQVRCEASAAYRELSRRVFLGEHCPFSLLDRRQLELTLELLEIGPGHRVLDLGCGVGTVTEALQRTTGARCTGLDLAETAIERARERTAGETRLDFRVADLEALGPWSEPWDRLVAIDVLYFLQDPGAPLARLLPAANPGARMVLAASDVLDAQPSAAAKESGRSGRETRLGKILTGLDLPFEAHDVSSLEEAIWRRQAEAARDLLPAFTAEGSRDLGDLFLQEAKRCLPWVEAGRTRRFLYSVEVR
jgi:2-polyprenyl-3-methyl-5-hydroxy-6-metoxy-1,4-benzoquinol methylase